MTFNYEDFRKRFRVAALARGIDPATGSSTVQAAAVAVELGIVIAGGSVRAATPIGDVLEDVREWVHRPTEEAAIAAVMRGQPRQGDKLPITLETLRELYPEVRQEMAAAASGHAGGGDAGGDRQGSDGAQAAAAAAGASSECAGGGDDDMKQSYNLVRKTA